MSERQDETTEHWPLRPWIMAAIGAFAGLAFHLLTDHDYQHPLPALRQAVATLVVIATVGFVLTIEKERWLWSLAFAVGWGVVIALVGWFTAQYNQAPTIFEWPYLSGIFAVLRCIGGTSEPRRLSFSTSIRISFAWLWKIRWPNS